MTNLRTDESLFCNLTKIGTDENKAIYSTTRTLKKFVLMIIRTGLQISDKN